MPTAVLMPGVAVLARVLLLALTVTLAPGCGHRPVSTAADGYFPTDEWRTSTPEAQGLDSDALAELFVVVADEGVPIHSLQLVRNGHLVLDVYFHPFARGRRHDVASVTKSITTTLVGQALARGELPGIDAAVRPLLAASSPAADPRWAGITIRHLLTNTSGLACGGDLYERETLAMAASPHWVEHALSLSARERPGTRFSYCSPGFHLLAALVSRHSAYGSAEEFARAELFEPLGITDFSWPRDPDGVNRGGGDLQMRPTDMARIGYLFLREGNWTGRQVVPRDWVRRATRSKVDTPSGDGYGFGWWTSRDLPGMYRADGRGGQRIVVWPEQDIVLVTTGGGFDPLVIAPHLLRALKGRDALPPNPAGVARLQERIAAAAEPGAAVPVPAASSSRTAAISGVEFRLDHNPLGMRAIRLDLASAQDARVEIEVPDGRSVSPLGLDGMFRYGTDPRTGELIGGRGRWTGEDEFLLEVDTVGLINFFTARLRFAADVVEVHLEERAGLLSGELRGRQVGAP